MTFLEPLRYLIRELHESAERLYAMSSEPEDMRRGVLMFMANGLQAATELARVSNEEMAGWLTVRTLWHNTACLAMFLLDERGHRRIAGLLDLDCDLRSADILVHEAAQILGGKEAKLVFEQASFDPRRIVENAQSARKQKPSKGGWESIRVSDLKGALRRLCDEWKQTPEIAQQLRILVKLADVSRTHGDAIAHPNLFGVQTLLQVVDLEEGRITLDPLHDASNTYLKQITGVHLLLLHAAVLAWRFPSSTDLPKILQQTERRMTVEADEPDASEPPI